ncbi:kinase-binding protein CGI-121 [Medicago truncatula]|uniref:Kinase-binding protein CGI-121 n=1 Tax=Medicago truncatula TaxID=3880 RepID=A0A072VDH1_MEDTR|nr:kinase-binding protein CGI-121 [Medicago truncatula]
MPIPYIFPVIAAAHKTLVAKSQDSLTTHTLQSELVYNYSGSKHITESLKRCGISGSTIYILAARFDASPDEIKAIEKLVIGKEIDLEELERRANQSQIQKYHHLLNADATCRIAARLLVMPCRRMIVIFLYAYLLAFLCKNDLDLFDLSLNIIYDETL